MAEKTNGTFGRALLSRWGLALAAFLAVAGFFLWQEHRAHVLGYLPLILVLGLCLGMHFLMHGGHGGGGHGSHHDGAGKDER